MATNIDEQIRHEEELAKARKESDVLTKNNMAINILGNTLGSVANSKMGVSSGSSMKQNVGMLQRVIQPYIVIKTKQPFYPPEEHIGKVKGLPSNNFVTVGKCEGFTRFSGIHLEIEGALDEELSEIDSLLKGGVILNYEQTK